MKKIAIVGYGRFGKTLHRLCEGDFEMGIFHHDSHPNDIFNFSKTIFYCVPIDALESLIKKHKKYIGNHLLIDVLSVKEYPKKIFAHYLRNTDGRSLLTHPLFGPDSSKNGFENLPIVMDKNTALAEEYTFWKSYFENKKLKVVEISARDHDKLAALSQGLTHFVGRLLASVNMKQTPIDTLGAKKLLEVMDQTCNDTWQLFVNLQNYNPYTKNIRLRLGKAYEKLQNALLPRRINKNYLVFGIQGGKGSFNEEAVQTYIKKHAIQKYRIKYLYTTKKVLKNIYEGTIDYGLFAIQNASGGVVQESAYAMAEYRFAIQEEFSIQICHHLMKRKDAQCAEIKKIMAHDQVFKQCKNTLKNKYPELVLETGKGDYVDTAKAAQGLSEGKVSKNVAILGPRILATLYNFDIMDSNLQDNESNPTTFFMVKRNR